MLPRPFLFFTGLSRELLRRDTTERTTLTRPERQLTRSTRMRDVLVRREYTLSTPPNNDLPQPPEHVGLGLNVIGLNGCRFGIEIDM